MSYNPDTTSPPGETIECWMRENNVETQEMARRLGIAPKTMECLLKGEVSINHWLAQTLQSVTEVPAKFWIERERSYREMVNNGRKK